jgi:hypothetical protein
VRPSSRHAPFANGGRSGMPHDGMVRNQVLRELDSELNQSKGAGACAHSVTEQWPAASEKCPIGNALAKVDTPVIER